MNMIKAESIAPVFDLSFLSDCLDGDVALVDEVVGIFIKKYPEHVSKIEEAIRRNSAAELKDQAHALKSVLLTFGYKPAVRAATKLEDLAREGITADAAAQLETVKMAIQPILTFIQTRPK